MENDRPELFIGLSARAGVSHRAYVQLVLLGAMVPVELAVMARWSAPAGVLLLGGTIAASVTAAAGPRVLARILGSSARSVPIDAQGKGHAIIRLAPATKGSKRGMADRETIEAALRRVCYSEDSVTATAAGGFIVELRSRETVDLVAIGNRITLAIENRLAVTLNVNVERRQRSARGLAAPAIESPLREARSEIVDGYFLRRNIFGGEPKAATSSGGELFRRARARLQSFAPVAV